MNTTELLVNTIVKGLQEKKGREITIVDMREIQGAICQYMVIGEGKNPNQITSMSDAVWGTVNGELHEKPITVHGVRNAQWVGMDYGTVIVHIFQPEARTFYRLESLWGDSVITKIKDID